MPKPTLALSVCRLALPAALLVMWLAAAGALRGQDAPTAAQKPPAGGGEATLEADQQRVEGKIFYAEGNVDVHYLNARLRADHVEYNSETQVAVARGHVQLDYLNQHVEADDARYELRTGRGSFHKVRGTFAVQRHAAPNLLISPNPIYFEAEDAERLDENTYKIRGAWLTVCVPGRPTWKFHAPAATVRLQKSVHLANGNFRVYSVPIVYLPYATFPTEKRRNSGFLVPEIGHTSQKGLVLGDAFYWAPLEWMDATVGAYYYSSRGWSQRGDLRMRPWEDARFEANYFGVDDRGLSQPTGPPIKQGGEEAKVLFTSPLAHGWRAVADLDQLSSLTFRLAWSETYVQAVNSEVRNAGFLTNNFRGLSLNFAALNYQNYFSATPQTSITLRTAPEARFSSVDQRFVRNLLAYFSFSAFAGGAHREENVTPFETPEFVQRSEMAPSVAIPLHFGDWLKAVPSFTFRSTYYGGQQQGGVFVGQGFWRNTEEFALDVRLPVVERVWKGSERAWKHTMEPGFAYRYVSGVNDFGRFVRFDEDETLTDTNEIEYGITQRLFRRTGEGGTDEFLTWRLVQKYFFDPTFGGALVPGKSNVFQTLDALTPFAFADQPRRWSPLVSDLKIEPGRRLDTQFIVNYDTQRGEMSAIGVLAKVKPYKETFLTVADFSVLNMPVNPATPPANFEQRSNQIRAIGGYGDPNRRGWNVMGGASYDITRGLSQNQVAEVTYNGSCCGVSFEYRRFSFGTIRNENQYSFVFRIANLGSAGNLRRQEKVF